MRVLYVQRAILGGRKWETTEAKRDETYTLLVGCCLQLFVPFCSLFLARGTLGLPPPAVRTYLSTTPYPPSSIKNHREKKGPSPPSSLPPPPATPMPTPQSSERVTTAAMPTHQDHTHTHTPARPRLRPEQRGDQPPFPSMPAPVAARVPVLSRERARPLLLDRLHARVLLLLPLCVFVVCVWRWMMNGSERVVGV